MNYKEELITYRRERAKEALEDARILLSAKRYYSAVNRIYYAMFYEVVSLLLTKELSSSKHSGVRAYFNEHFVKTGKVRFGWNVMRGRFEICHCKDLLVRRTHPTRLLTAILRR